MAVADGSLPVFPREAAEPPAGRGPAFTPGEVRAVLQPVLERAGLGGGGGGRAAVRIVATFDDLPDPIKQAEYDQGGDGSDIRGVQHLGTVTIVADQHDSRVALERTLFHELHGHLGIRALSGGDTGRRLRAIVAGLGGVDGMRGYAARPGVDLSAYDRAFSASPDLTDGQRAMMLTDELLAQLAEHGPPGVAGKVRAVIGAVRDEPGRGRSVHSLDPGHHCQWTARPLAPL